MPKLTQKKVKELADRYSALQNKIKKLEADRNAELHPLLAEHNRKTKPIEEKYSKQIDPLKKQSAALATEILSWLEANKKPIALTGRSGATAALNMKVLARVIPPKVFFDITPEEDRNDEFWSCVTIEIGKAEKFLGKTTVDDISEKPTRPEPTLTLKS